MANIGSLDFEILIDDTKFNQSILNATQAAKDLNVTLSDLLDLRKKYRAEAQSSAKAEKDATRALRQQNTQMRDNQKVIRSSTNDLRRYNREKGKMGIFNTGASSSLSMQQGVLSSMTSLAAKYVSIWGAAKFLQNIVRVTAEFDLQRTALRSMLGDIQAADELYNKIWDLAVRSPFNAKELVTYAKQLAAYSIPLDQIYDTTKMLADVSAGLGVGMDRLVLAYGQIRSASFLRGQEVRQLTEAGIPILEELRKQFVELGEEAITAGDVFDKISKRLVPFEMVEKVFKNMTSEGGKFYNMQEIQAETLKGKLMILKDAYDKMFNAIGSKNSSSIKGAVDWVTNLARNYEKTIGILKVLISTYGAYKVAMLSTATMYNIRNLVSLINIYIRLAKSIKQAGQATTLLGGAFKSLSPRQMTKAIGGIAGAISLVVSIIMVAINNAHALERELQSLTSGKYAETEKLVSGFEELYDKLANATKGSQEYRDAISKLNRQYEDYLPQLLTEENALDVLRDKHYAVADAIRAQGRAYAEAEGLRAIQEQQGKKIDSEMVDLSNALVKATGISKDQANAIVKNFKDAVSAAIEAGKNVTKMEGGKIFHDIWASFFSQNSVMQIKNPFDITGTSGKMAVVHNVNDLSKAILNYDEAINTLNDDLDTLWGDFFSTANEMQRIKEINESWDKEQEKLYREKHGTDEYNKLYQENEISRLQEILKYYEELNEKAGGGKWLYKINETRDKLSKLRPGEENWLQKLIRGVEGAEEQRLLPQEFEMLPEYVENLRKQYKGIIDEYEIAEATYKRLVDEKAKGASIDADQVKKAEELYLSRKRTKEVMEAIGKALGVSVDDKLPKDNGKSKEQIEIETRISTIKDLMSWYDKFKKAGANDEEIQRIFTSIFPDMEDVIVAHDYRNALLELADALNKYDEKAAQALRDDVGVNKFGGIYDSLEAALKFRDELKKWMQTDFGLEGEDAAFKLSNFLTELNTKNMATTDTVATLKENLAASELAYKASIEGTEEYKELMWLQYKQYSEGIIEDIAEKERNANRKTAQEKTNDLARAFVSSIYSGENMFGTSNISKLFNKSTKELTETIKKLQSISVGENLIDEATVQKAQELGISFEELLRLIQGIVDADISTAQYKQLQNIQKSAKSCSTIVGELGTALQSLGNATNDGAFKSLGKALDVISDISDAVLENTALMEGFGDAAENAADDMSNIAKSTDWVTMIIKIALIVIRELAESISQTNSEMAELQDAMIKARSAAREYYWTMALNSSDSIFGDNMYAQLKDANKVATEALAEYTAFYDKLADIRDVSKSLEKSYSSGNYMTYEQQQYVAAIAAGYSKIEAITVKIGNSSLFNGATYKNIKDAVEALGYSFYDANGRINAEGLQAVLNTYTALRTEDKAWIQEAIDNEKKYQDALKQTREVMKTLIGDIADNAVDNIIDGWINAGNAALDYSDILSDVARSYAQMMIKSQLMSKIFDDKFVEEITQATINGNSAQAVTMLEQKMADIAELEPDITAVLSSLNQWLKTSDSSSIGSSIKGVTEDTANLLGAYINGMRADLSAQRIVIEGIGVDMKSLVAHIPTLDDYLNQIAANTYNTAQSTNGILSNLESMMTNAGGETALRVFM